MKSRQLTVLPNGCTLTPGGLAEQSARAAALREQVHAVERSSSTLSVKFRADVDTRLVSELIATERGCCSFLEIDYDAHKRALRVSVDDSRYERVLDALNGAFAAGGGT